MVSGKSSKCFLLNKNFQLNKVTQNKDPIKCVAFQENTNNLKVVPLNLREREDRSKKTFYVYTYLSLIYLFLNN